MATLINALPVNGLNPVTVGGTGTAIKYFPNAPGASIGVASTQPGQLNLPGSSRLLGQRFNVLASGSFTNGATSTTTTITLAANTAVQGATPSYTALGTSGAIAFVAAGTYAWSLVMTAEGDSVSSKMNGQISFLVANVIVAAVAIATFTGVNWANEYPFGLVVGVTFSGSDASNAGKLTQFQLEA